MAHKSRQPLTRRDALCRMGNGFGMLAFASLVNESIVRATGGLADTVADASDANLGSGRATGFAFVPYHPAAFRGRSPSQWRCCKECSLS